MDTVNEKKIIGTKLYIVIMLAVFSFFLFAIYSQYLTLEEIEHEISVLESDLNSKNEFYKEQMDRFDAMYTDKHVEERARALGLVKDGEIVYVIDN